MQHRYHKHPEEMEMASIQSWLQQICSSQNIVFCSVHENSRKLTKQAKKHSPFCQGQERQMESEDYHYMPAKSEMGDCDKLGGIRWRKRKEG